MYKIVGNDGKTYGPVTADQIREWIAQGRIENRTAVLSTGGVEWTFVGLLPEFAPLFHSSPPVIAPPKVSAILTNKTNGFATAGLVCGILSCLCCCGCPFSVLGLIFSIIALVQINTRTEKQAGWGLALAGLICSAISLLISFGLGIFQLALTPANLFWHVGVI
jgi:hypothetical protein